MRFTHVIFDLDGTLLNTIDDLADAGNHVCAAHGWPTHTVQEFKRMVGNGIPKLVERFAPPGLSAREREGALREFSAWYGVHKQDKTAPYAGVPETLRALKAAGLTLAVLSNKAHELAGAVVEHYYPGVFDAVRGAAGDAPLKPDPALLNRLLETLGAPRESTLFVGDSGVDVLTGKNGGLAVCGVLWGFRGREELERAGADCFAAYPGELAGLATGTELLLPGQTGRAVRLLREGRAVALPTETVYGLASDAGNEAAVRENYEIKGRPAAKPLNVLVDGMDMVERVCRDIPGQAYRLAEAFWPGPLTMILRGGGALPSIVPAGGDTQGVRCPDQEDTLAVIRALGRPLACPSANLSGRPSPKNAPDVFRQLAGRVSAVLDAGECAVGVESTILDLTVRPFRILRQGGLGRERIERALGERVDAPGASAEPGLVIGLTGPTGAGKTAALRALEELGAVVLDCDALYHELTRTCAGMLDELRGRFGDGIFDTDGALKRKALGGIVFRDKAALADLNAITHRYVLEAVEERLERAGAQGRRVMAVDAIALFESGLAAKCGVTVAVTAPDEARVRRVMARDGVPEAYARARVAAQRPCAWFEARCDHTLRNDGDDPAAFYAQARAFFSKLISEGGV